MKTVAFLFLLIISVNVVAEDMNKENLVTMSEDQIVAAEALSQINEVCGTSVDPSTLKRPDSTITVHIRNVDCKVAHQLITKIDQG